MDWIASLLTLIGLLLNAKKSLLCWPVWVAGNVLWVAFGAGTGQVPILLLNLAFIVANGYGWRQWSRCNVAVGR
jgi:nicotinamide riboside transporter PnuC